MASKKEMSSLPDEINRGITLDVFNEAFLPYLNDIWAYEVYWGGAGAGKSNFIAHKLALQMTGIAGRNLLCVREHKNDCDTSVYPEIYSALSDFDLLQYWHIVEKPAVHMECLLNGNQIKFDGMDNIEDIKSIKFKKRRDKNGNVVNSGNITDIWYEEASAEKEKRSLLQFDIRLRDNVQKGRIIISFNPVNSTHFLKKLIEEEWMPTGDCIVSHTTYKDNKFLPKSYGVKMEAYRFSDPYMYQVYTLGNWGVLGDSVFDKNAIANRIYALRDQYNVSPPEIGDFEYAIEDGYVLDTSKYEFACHSMGCTTIYKAPEPGHPYVFGLDTAGEGAGDFHAGHVIDNVTGEQVAVFHSLLNPDWCVYQEYFICRFYNDALFIPEVNFDSYHVAKFKEWGYTNIYQRESDDDDYSDRYEPKLGFLTTRSTRKPMLDSLQAWANRNIRLINDVETLNEMLSFVRLQKPLKQIFWGAESGSHDDLVMALAIALEGRSQQSNEIEITVNKLEGDWDEWELRDAVAAGTISPQQAFAYKRENGIIEKSVLHSGNNFKPRRRSRYAR